MTTIVGVTLSFIYAPRTWCSFCPMGTISNWVAPKHAPLPKAFTNIHVSSACQMKCKSCARVCPMQLTPYDSRGKAVGYLHPDCLKKTPVVIDFYATWCGPCQAMAPMLQRLAQEYEGRIKVLKVDVDKNQALAAAANIMSIPTLFLINKDGDIERQVGGMPYQQLTTLAERIMD